MRLLFLMLLSVAITGGCKPSGSSHEAPPVEIAAVVTSSEPSQVDLIEATAKLNDVNVVQFEVNYAFSTGRPNKFYLCEIAFPGTEHKGLKAMEAWELKPTGTIKGGVELPEGLQVDKFSVTLSEADSPDRGYTKISNVLDGNVQLKADSQHQNP